MIENTLTTVEGAAAFAALAHIGQVDKAGRPYVFHVLRVGMNLAPFGTDYAIAGMLHDVLEDTSATVEDLVGLGASRDVISAVLAVTKTESESTLGAYEKSIRKAAADPMGLLVKAFDVIDNAGRLGEGLLDPAVEARLRVKYVMASGLLAGFLEDAGRGELAAMLRAMTRTLMS